MLQPPPIAYTQPACIKPPITCTLALWPLAKSRQTPKLVHIALQLTFINFEGGSIGCNIHHEHLPATRSRQQSQGGGSRQCLLVNQTQADCIFDLTALQHWCHLSSAICR